MSSLDLLQLPLRGRQVIEASAGTGKTWTLAVLYLRWVLGHGATSGQGLQPSQILVMTFTEAATAELRERIRDRLHSTALWLELRHQPSHPSDIELLQALFEGASDESRQQAAARLHLAAQNMDEAAIFTIHGWSRRMLGSFALHSRDLFEQTHLDQPSVLLSQLLHDHWRRWFYPLPLPAQAALQQLLGGRPDDLLPALQQRWQALDRKPRPPATAPAPPQQVLAEFVLWQEQQNALCQAARQAWTPATAEAVMQAQATKKLKGSRVDHVRNWLSLLQAWAAQDQPIKADVLQRFALSRLQAQGWPEAAAHPVFARIEAMVENRQQQPACQEALLDHAAYEVRARYDQAKQQQSAFDFQDLLQRLHSALHADQGQMAAAIRAQYPVAMVDEFQDTDPWQYESLDRIYDSAAVDAHNALIMIGDPKQAIYSFRGADLRTYLQARETARQLDPQALHSLDSNFRSTPALVRAINHVFGSAKQPFHTEWGEIDFVQVHGRSPALPLRDAQGQALTPFTVWLLGDPPDSDKPQWTAPLHVQHMARGFAAQMVELLHTHSDIHPGDMAVLVRTKNHAQAMQSALRQVGLPSVYLSDHANVYQSDEAQDLWRVLRAICAPRQMAWLRSALATRIWGLSLSALPGLLHDDAQADARAESCQRWLQQWQSQGVLPMMHSWLHEEGIAARLLRDEQGERRLTNLLHLGELLQHASQSLQGPQALLQHLVQHMQDSPDSPEAQKSRLETDAQCVQIITYHKSKGLEYPLVFVPFLSSFKAQDKRQAKPLDHEEDESPDITESSIDEDMRLIYVALTRAKRGLWLGLAHTASQLSGKGEDLKCSAVSKLLQRQNPTDLRQQLDALWGTCPDIAIQALPAPQGQRYQRQTPAQLTQAPLTPQRSPHKRWWTASFSSLTRGLEAGTAREEAFTDAHADALSSDVHSEVDSAAAHASEWQSFPAGARYGSLLHDLLEWQALNDWPLAQASSSSHAGTQQAWQALLQRKLDFLQLPEEAQGLLTPWLTRIMSTPLPLWSADDASQAQADPLCLQHLQAGQHWAEMDFSLCAGRVASSELDALIQQHVLPGQARPVLQTQLMQGMLTGFMDLVVEHQGRYWVLDYKSNKLAQYQAANLQSAVLENRYEVQYVLYTLALHRLLKHRLPGYNYAQHMGGAIYVFLRGIDNANAGVHALRPAWALIDQLDRLFAQVPP